MKNNLIFIVIAVFLFTYAVAAQTVTERPQTVKKPDVAQPQPTPPELDEAARLSSSAKSLYETGKFDAALPLAKRVLAIREKVLEPNHPLIAEALYHLARILSEKKQYKEAEPFYQRALTMVESSLGPKDATLIEVLESYACLLRTRNRIDEASKLEDRAINILFPSDNDKSEAKSPPKKIISGKPISLPQPGYPEAARQEGVSGPVYVRVVIDEKGNVIHAFGCGHPLLVKAAEETALLVRFTPTLADGKPTRVRAGLTYHFTR